MPVNNDGKRGIGGYRPTKPKKGAEDVSGTKPPRGNANEQYGLNVGTKPGGALDERYGLNVGGCVLTNRRLRDEGRDEHELRGEIVAQTSG